MSSALGNLAEQPAIATEPRCLVIGNLQRDDFIAVKHALHSPHHQHVATVAQALEMELEQPFDLCLLAQSYAGEFVPREISQLQSKYPLLPLLQICGTWCEGERRSGKALAGVPRIAWHEWPAYWQAELARIARGELPTWWLPAASGDEERILARCDSCTATGCAAVVADHAPSRQALADLCRAAGMHVVATSLRDHCQASPIDLIIWDAADAKLLTAEHVGKLRRRFDAAPLVALVTFPRPQDASLAEQLQIEHLVGKPYAAEILFHQLAIIRQRHGGGLGSKL